MMVNECCASEKVTSDIYVILRGISLSNTRMSLPKATKFANFHLEVSENHPTCISICE